MQSYGSRYVRPPIIAGDVSRAAPMTVHEFQLAQAVTQKPVKGMLTGPCTILNWSFPRKDLPRSAQAFQIALAIRELSPQAHMPQFSLPDLYLSYFLNAKTLFHCASRNVVLVDLVCDHAGAEVADLESAGCRICQVDEPAIREGLPLKSDRWGDYLGWATKAFRLATGCAGPATQIVTHLCYSQFEDILPAIDALDGGSLPRFFSCVFLCIARLIRSFLGRARTTIIEATVMVQASF